MAIPQNYKCEIGMESTFGDGGASFTPIPLTFDSIPKLRKTDTTLPVIGGSKARQKSYPDNKFWEIPFKFFLKGASGAGTASELGKLLRTIGFEETVNVSTSVTYDPRDSSYESSTLKINTDGVQYLCKGAKGVNFKIPLRAGERTICEGTLWALYTEPTAVSYSAPSFADVNTVVPIVESLGLTIDGNTHVIPEITFTFNMNTEPEPNVNAANNGVNDWAYGIRDWTFEAFAKVDTSNDIEFWTKLGASTEMAVVSTGYGTAGGNKWDFDMNNVQIIEVEQVERVGNIYYRIVAGMNYAATISNQFRMKHL